MLLSPGSIIRPGNYGRIIRQVGEKHCFWQREAVLERVRAERFADKPSRLASCFACSSIDAARCYRDKQCPTCVIYTVEKADAKASEHRADFNVVQPLPRRSENMEQIAELYWRSALWCTVAEWPGVRCEEVVTCSPLRIIDQID